MAKITEEHFQLRHEDLELYLKWGFSSPLWDQQEPTEEDLSIHYILGRVSAILVDATHKNPMCPYYPDTELFYLYNNHRGEAGFNLILKYIHTNEVISQLQLSLPGLAP